MASGYRSGGVDFDDLFDLYVEGPYSQDTGRRVGGVDLSRRYAHIQYGSKRADVGHRVGGLDLSNLWAAKGTASYQGIASNFAPKLDVTIIQGWTGPSGLTYPMQMLNTGIWRYFGGTQGINPQAPWTSDGQAPRDGYEVIITNMTGGGDAVWAVTNNAPNWVPLNASTSQTLITAQYNSTASQTYRTYDGGCTLTIRKAATGQVVWSGGVPIKCYSGQIRET
ncbi:hypothetical protein [Bradyrhizobium yuanmingense]|uniref:hypothetical protein n=1 Tax=Bradyrhizobium yuanmingense TaxID=108015 RepID=UPI0004B9B036|nr:hypothetical protein [Bradyrhizobium yuanmingense]